MADSKTRGRSADQKRLNKSEPYEVAYARSERASPARKAMLGESGSGRGSRSAKSTGKRASSAKSGASAKRSSGPTSAKKSGGSRKSASKSAGRKATSGSTAGKSASRSTPRKSSSARGEASSASPAMKRTNASKSRKPTPSTRATPNPPKEEKTIENTAPKTMREADAVDLLTDDHLEVSALFKRYERLAKKDASGAERRALAQSICDALKTHTTLEEEIFYPAARSAGIDADLLDEAKIEHASAKDLIAQIESGNVDDDLYDARVTVLGEYIQHHVVEEQTEMFPKCRRAGMDLVALRGELEARKMSIAPEVAAGAIAGDGAARGSDDDSPGLLAKLSDKLFSADSGADKPGHATTPRG